MSGQAGCRKSAVGRSQGTRARIATGVSDWWVEGGQWWSYEAVRTALDLVFGTIPHDPLLEPGPSARLELRRTSRDQAARDSVREACVSRSTISARTAPARSSISAGSWSWMGCGT